MRTALTDIQLKKSKPSEKPYKLSDSGNLYLWVTPSGGEIWRWAYKFEGNAKLMPFGKYPDIPLALATERHGDGRKVLAASMDPMAERKAGKVAEQVASENSFSSVSQQWLEHWQDDKSLRHVDSTRRRLAANILPSLGTLQTDEIEAPDIVAMVRAIEARRARDIAKRALETTGQIFRCAIAHGCAKRNPATEIRRRDILKATHKVNFARIDAKELPSLLRQLEVYPGRHVTRLAIKLLALTFVRTGELIGARWCEFDFEAARWNIPAERMKMRTPHIVPLASQALEVLAQIRELTDGNEFVFPGERNGQRTMSNNTILKGLTARG